VYDVDQFAYIQEPLMKWLSLKIAGKSLADILQEKNIHEIAIYGIHELGKLVYQDLNNAEISINCFIDKRAGEYPNGYQEVPVISLEELVQSKFDGFILVTPEFYFYDILQDLIKEGVALEKVISLAMIV
jgi:NADH/NAD ratio-sensing transcriptional regulator Rex